MTAETRVKPGHIQHTHTNIDCAQEIVMFFVALIFFISNVHFFHLQAQESIEFWLLQSSSFFISLFSRGRMKLELILIIMKICHRIMDNISHSLRHNFNTVSVSILILYEKNIHFHFFVRSFVRSSPSLSSFRALHIYTITHRTQLSDDVTTNIKYMYAKND